MRSSSRGGGGCFGSSIFVVCVYEWFIIVVCHLMLSAVCDGAFYSRSQASSSRGKNHDNNYCYFFEKPSKSRMIEKEFFFSRFRLPVLGGQRWFQFCSGSAVFPAQTTMAGLAVRAVLIRE